jgi:hypothetical protein
MKKNFLTAGAVMVAAILLATSVAQAADVTFGGEFWTRYEVLERDDFQDQTEADTYIQSRVRLNANVNVNDSTSAFIQLHSNRTWGDVVETSAGTGAGGLSGTQSVNDSTRDVGLHQAYFTLKNFAGLPFDLKAGRQEIILDAHRLFGNTLWTMGAHSHDAIRLNHKHDNMTFSYGFIQQAEQQDSTADETTDNTREAGDNDDTEDVTTQFLYANFAGILGGKLSTMYIYTADGCGGKTGKATCSGGANDIHTIGFRQAGQLFGLDYRGEYYYQFGDAQGIASATTNGDATANPSQTNGFNNLGADVDRDAYMFGLRVVRSSLRSE